MGRAVMTRATVKNVFTIPSYAAFLDALACGLWRRAGQDMFQLAQGLILLPTRRAHRALRRSFLDCSGQAAMLLPRMQPLGDIDEEEIYFTPGDRDLDAVLPPAMSPLRRQLLLTQLIVRKDPSLPLDQAAQLAEALARFLDQVQIEGCDLGNLPDLVKDRELAEHWQETVAFLDILTKAWPAMLAAEGAIDPADRRNRILRAQAQSWLAQPPDHAIIAAGSTGSVPAAADLLDAVASLPTGMVILPGLDQTLDEAAWQVITESHPQFGMKKLLEKMDLSRDQVTLWT
jgi:ATP-dependent helicase/nuclease subunit B